MLSAFMEKRLSHISRINQLRRLARYWFFRKNGPTPASFSIFILFKRKFYRKNCRRHGIRTLIAEYKVSMLTTRPPPWTCQVMLCWFPRTVSPLTSRYIGRLLVFYCHCHQCEQQLDKKVAELPPNHSQKGSKDVFYKQVIFNKIAQKVTQYLGYV